MNPRIVFVLVSDVLAYFIGAYLMAQADASGWAQLVGDLGFPIAFLLMFVWGIWKWLLPYIEKQQGYAQSQMEKAQSALIEERRETRRERDEYLKNLTSIAKQLEKSGEGDAERTAAIRAIQEEIRDLKQASYLSELERLRKAAGGGD